ncbi:MAG: universal stress protein [Actinomycetota bacterium]|nr:universal stress protein [Actinomycetota bacterium]
MSIQQPPVVVGIDESAGADQALVWAVEEARSRSVPLRLVCAYGSVLNYGSLAMYGSLPPVDPMLARDVTAGLLATAAARANELAPELDVTTHVVDHLAARALSDASAYASLMVLGSRHLASVGSVLLGSVSAAVSARAACPVVVMRGPAGLAAEHAAVVVGVDGHPASEGVIEFAFDYASRRSVPLRAVLCWHPDRLAEMMWRSEPPAPAQAEAWLSEALAGWREKYPDVLVHSGVVRDHPVSGLVHASSAQDLLVVGSRGRHALAGTLLGSVSQGVLHHATCPVALIPSSSHAWSSS